MSYVAKVDEELADDIAAKVARMIVTMHYGSLGQAVPIILTNAEALATREWENQRHLSEQERQLLFFRTRSLVNNEGRGDDVWIGHEDVVSMDGRDGPEPVSDETKWKVTIAAVAIALLARRPVRVQGWSRFLRLPKLTPRQAKIAAKVIGNTVAFVRRTLRVSVPWAVGYLQDKIIESLVTTAWKVRGGNRVTVQAWKALYDGTRHVIVPIVQDELFKAALPQAPGNPRRFRLAKTRTGRLTPGPKVTITAPKSSTGPALPVPPSRRGASRGSD